MAAAASPNFTMPVAPASPMFPSGTPPENTGDESAMAAGLAAGATAGPDAHGKMTRPPHNIHGPTGPNMPAYGPSSGANPI
jgi:hypothetical protein